MKNRTLFQRFVACTTTAALTMGAVAPATVALAADEGAGLVSTLLGSVDLGAEDLVKLVGSFLKEYGLDLDLGGLSLSDAASVVTLGGDDTGFTVDLNELLADLGVSPSEAADPEAALERLYLLLGFSPDEAADLSAFAGGVASDNPEAILGLLEETGIADLTLDAVAKQLGEELVGILGDLSLDALSGQLADFYAGAADSLGKVDLNGVKGALAEDLDLNLLAEALGISDDLLPSSFHDFNDLKDADKLLAFADELASAERGANGVAFGDIIDLVALLDALGVSNETLPIDISDEDGLLLPSEMFAEFRAMDLNDLLDMEKLIDELGLGGYDLPEELFDLNTVKDPETLRGVFADLDLNQFLALDALFSSDLFEGIEVPDEAKDLDLNDLKSGELGADDLLEVLFGFDFDNVADVLGERLGLDANDLLGLFDDLDSFDDLKDLEDLDALAALFDGFDLDGYFDLLGSSVLGVENLSDLVSPLLGLSDLNDLKDPAVQAELVEGLGELVNGYVDEYSNMTLGELVADVLDLAGVEEAPTGWIAMGDGTWKYWDADAKSVRTGWLCVDGTWYYFDSFGTMKTNWQKIGNTWYFFGSSGRMRTGWQFVWGSWYFFGGANDGAMRSGRFVDDAGVWNLSDADGRWIGVA